MPLFQKILDEMVVATPSPAAASRGWTPVADFAGLVNGARARGLPLHLRPGIYVSGPVDVSPAGGRGPLTMTAQVGTVTIRLAADAPYLFRVAGIADVEISNVAFDGANLTLTDPSPTAALVRFGAGARGFVLRHCDVRNSTAAGIACTEAATGSIIENRIHACDIAVFSLDAAVQIERNWVVGCRNNGIQVWNSTIGDNGSRVTHNTIDDIANTRGGTGQFGNGIVVYRAGNVEVSDNNIRGCTYSAIRFNASSNGRITGNHCARLREVAIFVEAPQAGLDLDGGVVADNIVETAGSGIHVANSGLYNDGTARRVTVASNQVSNLRRTYIPEEKAFTPASGVIVEGNCNVVGNNIEQAEVAGILLGTNNAARDLSATGNLIHRCGTGIGYSANASAGPILISGNLITGYGRAADPSDPGYAHSGAIVSVSFDGADFKRDAVSGGANTDYGNAAQTQIAHVTVGMNEAR